MSHDMQIDPEHVYTIGAAARLVGLSASGLRDCERRGEITSTQTRGGHRRFRGADLLRLREASVHHVAARKPRTVTSSDAPTIEEAKARHTWLGQWIGRAQRELDPATPAEVRLRLAVDLEGALGPWGPASPAEDVQPIVTSLIVRAKQQAQRAEEETHRHEMKDELIDFAIAHLMDSLPRGVVGVAGSLERRQVEALLRAPLRAWLSQHLTGSEDWDRARELTDEWLVQWQAKQGHHFARPEHSEGAHRGDDRASRRRGRGGRAESRPSRAGGRTHGATPIAGGQRAEALRDPSPAQSGRAAAVGPDGRHAIAVSFSSVGGHDQSDQPPVTRQVRPLPSQDAGGPWERRHDARWAAWTSHADQRRWGGP